MNLFVGGSVHRIALSDVATQAAARAQSEAAAEAGAVQQPVLSPMPGKLVKVFVAVGQQASNIYK